MATKLKTSKGETVFKNLRKQYPVFAYQSFRWGVKGNDLTIKFNFQCGEIEFKPSATTKFPKGTDLEKLAKSRKTFVDHIVFHIGMIEMVSYWKATCSPKIHVACGHLSKGQQKWWKYLYYHGLGEFFYLNKINTNDSDFVNLTCVQKPKFKKTEKFKPSERKLLVPIGGGKDSLASVSILSKTKDEKFYLLMNPTKAAKDSVKLASKDHKKQTVFIKRVIDKKLLDLNARGFLNGHTPFSAMLAWYTTLTSVFIKTKYACLSNEASANEPTIIGTNINHQYSKTIDFEKNYNTYLRKYVSPHYVYQSLLRPLNEFQIVSIFSQNVDNLKIFKSCNVGSKEDKWCCNCSKCLFVTILLAAHIGLERTAKVFGVDILDQKRLKKDFLELIGQADTKPFECIGTIDEIIVAITMIKQKEPTHFKTQFLLRFFEKHFSNLYASPKKIKDIKETFFKGHRLNTYFKKLVYESYTQANS
jgi:hypothetical protein